MKIMLCILILASILTDVFAEIGAEKKVPYAIITSGNMLDNILRLQSMVINMSWELEATKSDLRTTKVALKTTEDKSTLALSDLDRMSLEIKATKTDLKTTKVALNTTEDKLTSALSELARMDVMNERIEEIANMTVISMFNHKVAFQAKQIKYPYTPGKYEALKFDNVSLNKGGGYNPASGIFTVPTTGIYVCLANVLPDGSNYFGIRLMREKTEVVKGYSGSGGRQGAATISYLATFNKGDHVWFDIDQGDTLEIEGGHFSSYGCYLLYD